MGSREARAAASDALARRRGPGLGPELQNARRAAPWEGLRWWAWPPRRAWPPPARVYESADRLGGASPLGVASAGSRLAESGAPGRPRGAGEGRRRPHRCS